VGLLDGRVAIVTGSGRGIGREFALCFGREGAKVVVNDVGVSLDGRGTEEDPAAQVCKEIEGFGGEAVPNYDSVSDFDAAGRIVQSAVDAFGTVDILVNNAGIVRDRSLLKMDESDFDAVIGVHLKGTFNCTRHAAPLMKDKGYGRIVNITSSAGLRGNFGQTNYGAAKAGIMGMTFVWSLELGKYGITVNAIAPSGATRMTASLFERTGSEPPPEENPALNAPLVAYVASTSRSRQRTDPRTDRVRVHDLPTAEADRVDVARRRLVAGQGRATLRQDTRPAFAACRHGDAEIDAAVRVKQRTAGVVDRPGRDSGHQEWPYLSAR